MDTSPAALLEFEAEVMDALAAAGSPTALEYLRELGLDARIEADSRTVEAMAWRVCVARWLELVSEEFAARVRTAAAEIEDMEHVAAAVRYLEEEGERLQPDNAVELFRGFVSLDVEFLSNPAVELLCLCINTMGRSQSRPFQEELSIRDEISIVIAEPFLGRTETSSVKVQRLLRDFPDDMLCLAELARDVDAYALPLAGQLAQIVNRRFRVLLTAAAHAVSMQLPQQAEGRQRVFEQQITR